MHYWNRQDSSTKLSVLPQKTSEHSLLPPWNVPVWLVEWALNPHFFKIRVSAPYDPNLDFKLDTPGINQRPQKKSSCQLRAKKQQGMGALAFTSCHFSLENHSIWAGESGGEMLTGKIAGRGRVKQPLALPFLGWQLQLWGYFSLKTKTNLLGDWFHLFPQNA